jgi:hypothetical protein
MRIAYSAFVTLLAVSAVPSVGLAHVRRGCSTWPRRRDERHGSMTAKFNFPVGLGRLRRLLRPLRAMTFEDRHRIISTVPCPNRKCSAKIGEPCRGTNFPHTRRVQAFNKRNG